METETATWSEFPDGGKAIAKQILASEEINKSKTAGLWESESEMQVGKLTIRERLLLSEFIQIYQFHQNRLASTYDGR